MLLKKCAHCRIVKPYSAFAKRIKARDGLQNRCRQCFSSYNSGHYSANAETIKAKVNDRRRDRIDRVNAIKTVPCVDCEVAYPPVVMDFDHVRGSKLMGVSEMVRRNKPWEMIETEIAKCDVVCANCHRIREDKKLQ